MTEEEMDAIIKPAALGEVTMRDRRVFLAAVEWAADQCDKSEADLTDGSTFSYLLLQEVASLG